MADNINHRSLKVFLCHSSNDKPQVLKLYSRLINDGIDAWLDKEKLLPGQNWQLEIQKAVTDSDVVIVCLSTQSVNKEGFVQKEIKIALDTADEKPEGTIFIIPARLENCAVPERLGQLHWVDLFSDDGYERLTKALEVRAVTVGAILTRTTNEINVAKINEQEVNISIPDEKSINTSQQRNKESRKKKTESKNTIDLTKKIEELETSKGNYRKPLPASSLFTVVIFWYTFIGFPLLLLIFGIIFWLTLAGTNLEPGIGSLIVIYIIGFFIAYTGTKSFFKKQNAKSLDKIEKEIQQLKHKLRTLQQ